MAGTRIINFLKHQYPEKYCTRLNSIQNMNPLNISLHRQAVKPNPGQLTSHICNLRINLNYCFCKESIYWKCKYPKKILVSDYRSCWSFSIFFLISYLFCSCSKISQVHRSGRKNNVTQSFLSFHIVIFHSWTKNIYS